MKVKITKAQIEKILEDPENALKAGVKISEPWWIIALKVAAYLIGLILAGAATSSCSSMIGLV